MPGALRSWYGAVLHSRPAAQDAPRNVHGAFSSAGELEAGMATGSATALGVAEVAGPGASGWSSLETCVAGWDDAAAPQPSSARIPSVER
jgi:hypothetical protein